MRAILLSLAVCWFAICGRAASTEGEITLAYSLAGSSNAAVIKEFGELVKASCSCRVSEFYGWEGIACQFKVKNTGSKPLWGQCCIAFYDKDRHLVGASAQSFTGRRGLRPGASRTLPLRQILLPEKGRYKEVLSYQATINQTETPPAKTKDSMLLEDP